MSKKTAETLDDNHVNTSHKMEDVFGANWPVIAVGSGPADGYVTAGDFEKIKKQEQKQKGA